MLKEYDEVEMLKEYDEVARCESMGVSKECALWNIARELSRKNDLLEVEMLCRTAEALRSTARGSVGDFHDDGYVMAENLACMAHKRICAITGVLPEAPAEEGEKEDEA